MAQLIDAPRNNLDNTVRLFDQFYNFNLVIDGSQYDIVYSYFLKTTNSKTIATNFTGILFRISNITGENALTLLDEMKKTDALTASSLMTYYLNSLKSKTTLYGIANFPVPNEMVQRNIVQ